MMSSSEFHAVVSGAHMMVGSHGASDMVCARRLCRPKLNPAIQDPHRVVQCTAHPEVLWTQHHCGIWKSTDRGANWTEVLGARPSNFGFAVVVHPQIVDTAWFVPLASDEKRVPVN